MTAAAHQPPAGLPPHVVAVLNAPATRPALARALRRVRGERGALVLLVVGPGAIAPEGVDLETAGRALLGFVSRERAVEIAAGRSRDAAAQLDTAAPPGGGWCLYLDAGQRCAVVPVAPSMAPRGDA